MCGYDFREGQVYGGSDYAVTSQGGDYTVHVVVGVDALPWSGTL